MTTETPERVSMTIWQNSPSNVAYPLNPVPGDTVKVWHGDIWVIWQVDEKGVWHAVDDGLELPSDREPTFAGRYPQEAVVI